MRDNQDPEATRGVILSITPFRYSPDTETRPAEPFYHSEYQSSLKKAQRLANKVRDYLVENANHALANQWISLDHNLADGIDSYLASIKKIFYKLARDATRAKAPRGFTNQMMARTRQLRYMLQEEISTFGKELGIAKSHATSGNISSYIFALMRPGYQKAQQERIGPGVTARYAGRLYEHIPGSGLTWNHCQMVRTKLNEIIQMHLTTVASIVDEVLARVEADIATMTVPDTAMTKYPDFAQQVTRMVSNAEGPLVALVDDAAGATEWAERLGYI